MGFAIRDSGFAGTRHADASRALRPCASDSARVRHASRIPHSESRLSRGFTLIELMAVILLLAIALTAVTFSFSKSLKSARITAASRDLVAALRYTRGQAIVKGQQEVLLLNLDDNSYTAPGKGRAGGHRRKRGRHPFLCRRQLHGRPHLGTAGPARVAYQRRLADRRDFARRTSAITNFACGPESRSSS